MLVDYTVIRRNRKTISIKIKAGKVIVFAPLFISNDQIQQTVTSHRTWIEKQLGKQRINIHYCVGQGEDIYLLGNKYQIDLRKGKDNSIEIIDDKLIVYGPKAQQYIKQYLISIVDKFVSEICDNSKTHFIREYRLFKAKWGCCYRNNRLIKFNYLLACLPVGCINGVIYHEIVHLSVSNHQKEFYHQLSLLYPQYKFWVKELNKFTIE